MINILTFIQDNWPFPDINYIDIYDMDVTDLQIAKRISNSGKWNFIKDI